jgi:hypothetical protein
VLLQLRHDVHRSITEHQGRLIPRLEISLDDLGDFGAVQRNVTPHPGQDRTQ